MHWGENHFLRKTFLVLCACIFTRNCINFLYSSHYEHSTHFFFKKQMLRNKNTSPEMISTHFRVLNSLPKNFLYFFPHLPLLLMSCYVLENLCENLSFFLRIFMLWINWFQCRNDSKSEKFCCGHDYTVSSYTLFFFLFCSIDLFCLVSSYFIYF